MKIVHINREVIRRDNDRKVFADLLRAKMEDRIRRRAQKKYAALLERQRTKS
jgi:hypothetical protein